MTIFDRFDETELLAYVEDELDAKAARGMAERLRGVPEVHAALERLRQDRGALRSTTAPALPIDAVAELEPRIARAMLMEMPPGSYRRRYHRRERFTRRLRLVAAVLLGAVVVGGAWVGASRVDWPGMIAKLEVGTGDVTPVTPTEPAPTMVVRAPAPVSDPTGVWPPPSTWIHHHPPAPPAVIASAPGTEIDSHASPPVTATFAVVLDGSDLDAAESALLDALSSFVSRDETHVAFVRNFTQQEARSLIETHLLARAPSAAPAEFAELSDRYRRPWKIDDPSERRGDMARLLREIRRDEREAGDGPPPSERLFGRSGTAPSFEVQLGLSDGGATHCLAIPASRLADFVAHLTLDRSMPVTLRAWDGGVDDTPSGSWVEDARAVRGFVADAPAEGVVLVPVVVRGD